MLDGWTKVVGVCKCAMASDRCLSEAQLRLWNKEA